MNNAQYWKEREEKQLKNNLTEESEIERKLNSIYALMMSRIQNQIDTFYMRYASSEGITLADAKERIDKMDVEAFQAKAKIYVKRRIFSQRANEELKLYNATMRINRLELLKANIGLEMLDSFSEVEGIIDESLTRRTTDELTRQAGILGLGTSENSKAARAIVNASFNNAVWSDRLWMYQSHFKNQLENVLTQGLVQGKNPRELSSDMEQFLTRKGAVNTKANTLRLLRTELARVQTEAQKKSFTDAGYDEYMFLAIEFGACSTCKELDGKTFKISEMSIGENAPPMHPNCRCSTAAYMDRDDRKRFLKDYETTKNHNVILESAHTRPVKKSKILKDVTERYKKYSKKGSVSFEEDYDMGKVHEAEMKIAKWIANTIGGKVTLLNEKNVDSVKTPDFKWRKKFWELKTISTAKAADTALRSGLRQIAKKPGGIILDCTNDIKYKELYEKISYRLRRSSKSNVDIIIKQNSELIKVLRYIK